MNNRRVRIVWTATPRERLESLPKKVQRGLLLKARQLKDCDDPTAAHKPLVGPLSGYYRMAYSRYRAIYCVSEEELPDGNCFVTIKVCFVVCGVRKEGEKKDVYRLAKQILKFGGFGEANVVDDPETDTQDN